MNLITNIFLTYVILSYVVVIFSICTVLYQMKIDDREIILKSLLIMLFSPITCIPITMIMLIH